MLSNRNINGNPALGPGSFIFLPQVNNLLFPCRYVNKYDQHNVLSNEFDIHNKCCCVKNQKFRMRDFWTKWIDKLLWIRKFFCGKSSVQIGMRGRSEAIDPLYLSDPKWTIEQPGYRFLITTNFLDLLFIIKLLKGEVQLCGRICEWCLWIYVLSHLNFMLWRWDMFIYY